MVEGKDGGGGDPPLTLPAPAWPLLNQMMTGSGLICKHTPQHQSNSGTPPSLPPPLHLSSLSHFLDMGQNFCFWHLISTQVESCLILGCQLHLSHSTNILYWQLISKSKFRLTDHFSLYLKILGFVDGILISFGTWGKLRLISAKGCVVKPNIW